jgi:hypothetical protein
MGRILEKSGHSARRIWPKEQIFVEIEVFYIKIGLLE